jgi:hypothetical protein
MRSLQTAYSDWVVKSQVHSHDSVPKLLNGFRLNLVGRIRFKQEVTSEFNSVGFEVLTAVIMNSAIFWEVRLCSLV